MSVFEDDNAITLRDEDSEEEERFVTVATDAFGRVLVGCLHLAGRKDPPDLSTEGNTTRAKTIRGLKMRREYDFSKGKRGAVVTADGGKTRITIRLDNEILDWFREQVNEAGGGNYQTMINNALREYTQERREPIEKKLRRVIREELKKKGAA